VQNEGSARLKARGCHSDVPASPRSKSKENTLDFAQTHEGKVSPRPPIFTPPTPDSFGGSLVGRQAKTYVFAMPRGFGFGEIRQLLKFLPVGQSDIYR